MKYMVAAHIKTSSNIDTQGLDNPPFLYWAIISIQETAAASRYKTIMIWELSKLFLFMNL